MGESPEFSANGKLLISGEYLVLKGARALALPVRYGQKMSVTPSHDRLLHWVSLDPESIWFEAVYDPATFELLNASDPEPGSRLSSWLCAARSLNPYFLTEGQGCRVEVTANYPRQWGLGSSSTLLYMLAQWAEVDPFDLFDMVSSGSGFDIACASRHSLLFYQRKNQEILIQQAIPGNALLKYAWFGYLGVKQDSQSEVSRFLKTATVSEIHLSRISELAGEMTRCETPEELCRLINEHENIISQCIHQTPVGKSLFPDFPGAVKSLGAWGGDFAMFVSSLPKDEIFSYLKNNKVYPLFSFDQLQITA